MDDNWWYPHLRKPPYFNHFQAAKDSENLLGIWLALESLWGFPQLPAEDRSMIKQLVELATLVPFNILQIWCQGQIMTNPNPKIRLVSSSHQVNTVMNSLSQTGSLLFHRAILRQDIPGIETHRMRRLHKICHNRKSVHLNTHTQISTLGTSTCSVLLLYTLWRKPEAKGQVSEYKTRRK